MSDSIEIAPCHLLALVQIYALPQGPDNDFAASQLMLVGIAEKYGGKWMLTDKGDAWMRMLLSTPVPKQVFIDPRTRKAIK